jgi:citrate synthase
VAAGALRWGEPVLDSAITRIDDHRLWYRGEDAIVLADEGVSFERVAELLWTGALPAERPAFSAPTLGASLGPLIALLDPLARPLDPAMLTISAIAAHTSRGPARTMSALPNPIAIGLKMKLPK